MDGGSKADEIGAIGTEPPVVGEVEEVVYGRPSGGAGSPDDPGVVMRHRKRDIAHPCDIDGDRDGERDPDLDQPVPGVVDDLGCDDA